MTIKKLPAKLKSVLTKHCPFDSTSMRMIQRVCALYLGQSGTIEKADLSDLCALAGLDQLANFRANFTMNMKKDEVLFSLKKHPESWTLTSHGKAEAKSIFEDNEAPMARPALRASGSKPKAAKKKTSKKKAPAKGKKKASGKKATTKKKASTSKKKTGTKKKAASKKTPAKSTAARKAAQRRKKKRNLADAPADQAAPQAAEATPEPAAASAD